MNSIPSVRNAALVSFNWVLNHRDIFVRFGLVTLFAFATHHLTWQWLRFVTSEAVLRTCSFLDIRGSRISFDVIELRGEQFQYLISCTFVDVFLASLPLLWNARKSLIRNVVWFLIAGAVLFPFNAIRLEIAVLLYFHGIPWKIADGLLGAYSYFIVWLAIWYTRSWYLQTPLKNQDMAVCGTPCPYLVMRKQASAWSVRAPSSVSSVTQYVSETLRLWKRLQQRNGERLWQQTSD